MKSTLANLDECFQDIKAYLRHQQIADAYHECKNLVVSAEKLRRLLVSELVKAFPKGCQVRLLKESEYGETGIGLVQTISSEDVKMLGPEIKESVCVIWPEWKGCPTTGRGYYNPIELERIDVPKN